MSLTKDEKDKLRELLQNDEDAQSKLDAKIEELLAEEDNGIDTASQAHDEAARQVIAEDSSTTTTDSSVVISNPPSGDDVPPPQTATVDSGDDVPPSSSDDSTGSTSDTSAVASQPSLGEEVSPTSPASADVSDSTDGLLVATDTAGGIKSVDPTQSGTGVVGGGDASPADLAQGFQPVPGQTVEQQLTPPTPDDSTSTQAATPEVASDTNFGHASTNLPGVTDTSDQKEAVEATPELTHQGQPGSGVQPGAALPGETPADRNVRQANRVASAEQQRAIENGNFTFAGKLNVQDGGGFDVVSASGTDSEQHLSDLLAVLANQNVSITITRIA